ncbi:hypothetical protein LY625_03535 [Lysobacter sp. GX 14042]|uniref:FHA domain-containing protein n=1 Tax=Lysobacter sp. GX 14042 TaxID=2907155 RepID=UPI001F3E7BBE|nr:FHA domain-containing protein [Lysobacter sp. GX 14042]MCE7031696.1 hypothetical protein [Lysobacter sp. GX 14042]
MSGHDDMAQDTGPQGSEMSEQVAEETIATGEQPPAPLVLRILSGLHDGASRVLSAQEMLLIGSGEDCDIILSDPGVARHHAMVLRHGDTLSLRAIDAPLEFAGDPLEPGDPIELPALEPARLGGVSIAIGPADAPGWTALGASPGAFTATPLPATPAPRPFLPTALVAVALLSLVSVGIYAMVRPAAEPAATPRERAGVLVDEYGVRDSELVDGRGKAIVLAGTVEDAATAARLQQRIADESLPIELRLRTGDDVARDVREVLRTFGITADTRYQGDGAVRVEPAVDFDDWKLLAEAGSSRVMRDVNGFTELLPPRDAPALASDGNPAPKPAERVRLITVVTGEDPHLIASDGRVFRPSEDLPDGRGRLSSISEKGAWAIGGDGLIRKIRIEPAAVPDEAGEPLPDEADTALAGPAPADAEPESLAEAEDPAPATPGTTPAPR